jgi:U5 small nuclear ribonucleoprotein component
VRRKRLEVPEAREALQPNAPHEFLVGLLATPALVRNVAVVGHLHHGKTSVLDMLVAQTHALPPATRAGGDERPLRFTDSRQDEREREMSIKACPVTLVHAGRSGKSYALNLCDAPGHVAFADEQAAALRLADGALLVVDAAEGVCMNTERALAAACAEGLPVTLFVNKLDRLIVELKLPPADAYFKLRAVLDELNALLAAASPGAPPFDPGAGNVCFGAASAGFCFTLESMAALYTDVQHAAIEPRAMAARLWGDWYYHPGTRAFKRSPPPGGGERSFVTFVLEPLYKVYSLCLGETPAAVGAALSEQFGVHLKAAVLQADVKPLLRAAGSAIFGDAACLVDMLARFLPSAAEGGAAKAQRCYTGPQASAAAAAAAAADPRAPLLAFCAKLVPSADGSRFDALCRVMAGTLVPGARVRVLGEAYSPDDEEDSETCVVTTLALLCGSFRTPLACALPGAWVLVGGVEQVIAKTATLVPAPGGDSAGGGAEEHHVFAPLRFGGASVIKVATEPLNPADLPRLVEGLRRVSKSYPAALTRVEESGEHTLCGTGELYLDCALRDLRELYADVEVKVADPTVRFCETCVETSSLKAFADTPNRASRLTMVAEPLDPRVSADAEAGLLRADAPPAALAAALSGRYGWDALAARSLWAFGPEANGANVLLDDTLPGEVDRSLLRAVRDSIVAGFQWGAREGPLCDEPLRGVAFKLLSASVAPEPAARGGGQVIPTARRVAYAAFLLATPRLMEPMLRCDIQAPADAMPAIYAVLAKRRGHVVSDRPVPGTPIYAIRALLPAIESFGFEVDLRVHTLGAAFGMSAFDSWAVVPGDPLDRSVVLRPLEPSPPAALAREFMVKTRRRKGLAPEVSGAGSRIDGRFSLSLPRRFRWRAI